MSGTGNKSKILIVTGGSSPEREISLLSAQAVQSGLKKLGHQVLSVDANTDFDAERVRFRPDVLFPVLHGPGGEDGSLQGYAATLQLPFVGSGQESCVLTLNKEAAKYIAAHHDIPTPQALVLESVGQAPPFLPCVVKPTHAGSTIGIRLVKHAREFQSACKEAFKYGPRVLVERFISGQEISAGVFEGRTGPRVLPLCRVVPKRGFFDYQAKYDGTTLEEIPAQISPVLTKVITALTLKIHTQFQLRDFSRSDFIVDAKGDVHFLEVNTIPGLAAQSILPKMLAAARIDFLDFLQTVIDNAQRRSRRE